MASRDQSNLAPKGPQPAFRAWSLGGNPAHHPGESMQRLQHRLRSAKPDDSGPNTGLESTPPRKRKLLAAALTSHVGVLLVFPTLVLGLGGYLIFGAQKSLRQSNLELAQARLSDQAEFVSEQVSDALAQADGQLESLKSLVQTLDSKSPPATVGVPLRRLLAGHPGASYISVSFPDGTFEGAFVDRDGTIRFRVSRVLGAQTLEQVYEYQAGETLSLRETRQTQYDPRLRPFYQLALASPGRVWTEPYPFADTNDTGITRTEAVRRGEELLAVLTFDYDIRSLSPVLKRPGSDAGRALLFDRQGTILADPSLEFPATAQAKPPHLFSYRTANDLVLTAFFEAPEFVKAGSFQTPQGAYMAATVPLHGKGRPDWAVAFLAPEAAFLAEIKVYSRRSFASASLALLLATVLSAAFARLIVRARKEATDAREVARRARIEARELGSYRLVEQLGVGGMGEVWRAKHNLLARDAAIKLIRAGQNADPATATERFQREAQSLAALRCRNTIEIFDYGVNDDGTFFYVMELLDGVDLDELVRTSGPQPPYRVVQILMQMCASLAEAHDAGLVHRDIKPANIYLCRVADELDVVKVLDFGLVRTLTEERNATLQGAGETSPLESSHRLTRDDKIVGTPAYMAPEQALGLEIDARADLYALGCVAFWLLSGRSVFLGKSSMAQLSSHISEPPPELTELCPWPVPTRLHRLIRSCLAKTPEARPPNAREIKAELKRILPELDASWEMERQDWWDTHLPAIRAQKAPMRQVSATTLVVREPKQLAQNE